MPEPWESRRAVNPIIIKSLELILLIQDLEVTKFPMGKMEFETVTYQRNNIVTDIIH